MTCFKTGNACSFDDDFNLIAPAILEADAVVYTMPVYWYSIPAQIKGVIDRIFSLVVGGKDVAGKKMGLICCCEEHNPTVMDGVRIPIERTAALLKWDMVEKSKRQTAANKQLSLRTSFKPIKLIHGRCAGIGTPHLYQPTGSGDEVANKRYQYRIDSSWMKIDDCLHYLIFTLKVTIIFTNIFQKQ